MRKSAIDALEPAIRAQVLAALGDGATIDDIVDLIRELGGEVSRSSVGRYSKRFAELAKQQRDMRTVAESFGREFNTGDDLQGRMMVQLMTSITTRMLMPHMTGEAEEDLSALELTRLAKAVKDAAGAAKIDVERERAIREEAGRRAKEAAANDAESAGRAAGASEETLRRIRAGILGLAA